MQKRLIDTLEDVIAAERLAAEWRRTYGADAERHCDSLIEARSWKEPDGEQLRPEQLRDVRRALRWV
jgi:hypothetical protein